MNSYSSIQCHTVPEDAHRTVSLVLRIENLMHIKGSFTKEGGVSLFNTSVMVPKSPQF